MAGSLTVAVFASDLGRGDAERSSIMTQTGAFFARKGARLLCLANDGQVCGAVLASAKSNSGKILILAGSGYTVPSAFAGAEIERIDDPDQRATRAAQLADVFVALPGNLASVSSLFDTWARTASGANVRPVAFLNRNRAFESLRGFATDIVSARVRNLDRKLIFADGLDDLWGRIVKAVDFPVA